MFMPQSSIDWCHHASADLAVIPRTWRAARRQAVAASRSGDDACRHFVL